MTAESQSHERILNSIADATEFLVSQVTPDRPAWGNEVGANPDPWTTAEILWLLNRLPGPPRSAVEDATTYLLEKQGPYGSWTSEAFAPSKHDEYTGDVPATAYSLIALLERTPDHPQVQTGLAWLLEAFNRGGWTTVPDDRQDRFVGTRYYSTSMALRAVVRAPKNSFRSTFIQSGIGTLLNERIDQSGWGFGPGRESDPTFTCYCLHAFADVSVGHFAEHELEAIRPAVRWLASERSPLGTWSDWQGNIDSVEATSYAVYILSRYYDVNIFDGLAQSVEWLIETQRSDGGWPAEGSGEALSSTNWVTFNAVLALATYLRRLAQGLPDAAARIGHFCGDFRSGDLDELLAPNLNGSSRGRHLYHRYSSSHSKSIGNTPIARSLDHTMFESIDTYVNQRVPSDEILDSVERGHAVELHQVYPPDFEKWARINSIGRYREISHSTKPSTKVLNYIRPRYIAVNAPGGKARLLVAVTPGDDYLSHYALMVRHVVERVTRDWNDIIKLVKYPVAVRNIAQWTKITDLGVKKGDVLILGYVEEIMANLIGREPPIEAFENRYYLNWRHNIGRRSVSFLGCRYSYWGSIAGQLVRELCKAGIGYVIYVGKLGSLQSEKDIYTKIFCPSHFIQMEHRAIVRDVSIPRPMNLILERGFATDSGTHISVPTVLEEDYEQRRAASALTASSIDNEIASVAHAINSHNREGANQVGFTCLHFATDYLRDPAEKNLRVQHDLGRDKTPNARQKKSEMIGRIANDILRPFLQEEGSG